MDQRADRARVIHGPQMIPTSQIWKFMTYFKTTTKRGRGAGDQRTEQAKHCWLQLLPFPKDDEVLKGP